MRVRLCVAYLVNQDGLWCFSDMAKEIKGLFSSTAILGSLFSFFIF